MLYYVNYLCSYSCYAYRIIERMSAGVRLGAILTIICSGIVIALPVMSHAQTLASPNYRFDESTLGAGGMVQSGSANYSVTSGLSDIGIGNSASANYQVNSGSHTPKDPYLTFRMISSSANFNTFSATTTSYATTSFSVANYTTFGYVVQVFGTPPTNATHTISPMATTSPPLYSNSANRTLLIRPTQTKRNPGIG